MLDWLRSSLRTAIVATRISPPFKPPIPSRRARFFGKKGKSDRAKSTKQHQSTKQHKNREQSPRQARRDCSCDLNRGSWRRSSATATRSSNARRIRRCVAGSSRRPPAPHRSPATFARKPAPQPLATCRRKTKPRIRSGMRGQVSRRSRGQLTGFALQVLLHEIGELLQALRRSAGQAGLVLRADRKGDRADELLNFPDEILKCHHICELSATGKRRVESWGIGRPVRTRNRSIRSVGDRPRKNCDRDREMKILRSTGPHGHIPRKVGPLRDSAACPRHS